MHTIEEIAALLHIQREASQHGGALKNIADAAYNRLVQINKDTKVDAYNQAEPDAPVEMAAEETAEEKEVANG
jgi:hypothetical protein